MKLFFTLAAFAASSVSAFDGNTGKIGEVDTNRAPRIFDPPKAPRAGYTLASEIKIDINAEMDAMGNPLAGAQEGPSNPEAPAEQPGTPEGPPPEGMDGAPPPDGAAPEAPPEGGE